jgi:hypothetical protein
VAVQANQKFPMAAEREDQAGFSCTDFPEAARVAAQMIQKRLGETETQGQEDQRTNFPEAVQAEGTRHGLNRPRNSSAVVWPRSTNLQASF